MPAGDRAGAAYRVPWRRRAIRYVRPARLHIDDAIGDHPRGDDHRILRRRQRRAARLSADPDRQIYDLRPAGLDIDHPDFHFPERRNRGGILQFVCMRTHSRLRAGSRWSFCDLRFASRFGRHIHGLYIPGGPPPDINPAGEVAGTYFVSVPSFTEHGFLRAKNGAFTTLDVPGASFTEILAINPSGATIGDFCGETACFGFIRSPHGSFTTINTPGSVACGSGSIAIGVNPAGAVTGLTTDPTCSLSLGYLRTPDGTITTFGVPGAGSFEPMAINPAALITGWFFDNSGAHGFLRTLDGAIVPFDVPGSVATFATQINAIGAIIGFYYDVNFVQHGFLRVP